jgi:cell volume regulation protein A
LAAGKLRVPGLLLFLGLGMLIGSDGTGWIEFDDYELARTIGIVALALILFEGGLTSGLVEIRPVLGTAVSLALIATPITAAIAGLAAAWLFDIDTKQGLLIGPSWRAPTARRSSRCCATRPCAGSWRARSRASRASTTRSPSCSCWR